jgi:hypothetical protein
LKTNEFGVAGNEIKVPTEDEGALLVVVVVIGASSLMQPSVPLHPEVVTHVVALAAPVFVVVLGPPRTVMGAGG